MIFTLFFEGGLHLPLVFIFGHEGRLNNGAFFTSMIPDPRVPSVLGHDLFAERMNVQVGL